MKTEYFIEGHKAKTDYSYEDTLILDDENSYASEEDAINKAKEYFEKDESLQLIVIYEGLKMSPKHGTKFLFKDKEGNLEIVDSWWKQNSCY